MRRLLVAGFVVAGSLAVGSRAVSAGQTYVPPPIVHEVRVGETLWSIAGGLAPSRDPREVVDDLMRANHLRSPVIEAGQTLVFPAP
jgi:LysM repeat protein